MPWKVSASSMSKHRLTNASKSNILTSELVTGLDKEEAIPSCPPASSVFIALKDIFIEARYIFSVFIYVFSNDKSKYVLTLALF